MSTRVLLSNVYMLKFLATSLFFFPAWDVGFHLERIFCSRGWCVGDVPCWNWFGCVLVMVDGRRWVGHPVVDVTDVRRGPVSVSNDSPTSSAGKMNIFHSTHH